jgi:hypothetical protein
MSKFLATEDYEPSAYVDEVQEHLTEHELTHLRVRRHADLVIIESGPKKDAIKHARLRRVARHIWRIEMASPAGDWEPTPYRDQLKNLLALLTGQLGWVLAPRE